MTVVSRMNQNGHCVGFSNVGQKERFDMCFTARCCSYQVSPDRISRKNIAKLQTGHVCWPTDRRQTPKLPGGAAVCINFVQINCSRLVPNVSTYEFSINPLAPSFSGRN